MTQRLGGLACVVALIVAACGGATPQASPGGSVASAGPSGSAAASADASGQPTRGGDVTISAFEDADTLDPTFSGTAGTRLILINTCEKLYDLDEAGGLVPQLAAEMPVVDGLEMTIKLRDNVKFNDGTPFDAAAVVKSLERHLTIAEGRGVPASSAASRLRPQPTRPRSS